MNDITDQAGFITSTGFWESPIGKQWLEESQKVKTDKDPKSVGMLLPVGYKLKLERFETNE